jgi:two-component system KDP operon response regulator KdpE
MTSPTSPAQDTRRAVLLVDDDVRLSEAIALYLRRQGLRVTTANDGARGVEAFHRVQPDVVVLDVMMPVMDGWEVCRRLREVSWVPIIMLTARVDESDRVKGLRMGADDYVVKPFSLKELAARIEAVLRRADLSPSTKTGVVYDDSYLRLETEGLQVYVAGDAIGLTATERRLLFHLAENAGHVLSPEQILRQVWGPEYISQHDYVKLYIWRVRQKIEPDPADPTYLRTERGLGYRFMAVRQTPSPA